MYTASETKLENMPYYAYKKIKNCLEYAIQYHCEEVNTWVNKQKWMLKFEETATSVYEIISKEGWTCGKLETEFHKLQDEYLGKCLKLIMAEMSMEESRVTDKLRKLDKDIKTLLKKNKVQWQEKDESIYDHLAGQGNPLSFRNTASSTTSSIPLTLSAKETRFKTGQNRGCQKEYKSFLGRNTSGNLFYGLKCPTDHKY